MRKFLGRKLPESVEDATKSRFWNVVPNNELDGVMPLDGTPIRGPGDCSNKSPGDPCRWYRRDDGKVVVWFCDDSERCKSIAYKYFNEEM